MTANAAAIHTARVSNRLLFDRVDKEVDHHADWAPPRPFASVNKRSRSQS